MRYVGGWVRFSALIISSLALISCGRLNSQSGSYDQSGLPASSGNYNLVTSDYPAVGMVVLPGGSGICSGTLVGKRAVLTASHCTQKAGTYSFVTSFGTFTTSTKENYGPGVVDDPNDISVLVFDEDVTSTNFYAIGDSVVSGETVRLVGYGCSNLDTRRGSGTKRTGTNVVAWIDEYVNFLTPATTTQRGIIGPDNRSGSCFGDSGGPGLKLFGSEYRVVSVTHAGGYWDSSTIISQYVDITRSDNRAFLSGVASGHGITISGL